MDETNRWVTMGDLWFGLAANGWRVRCEQTAEAPDMMLPSNTTPTTTLFLPYSRARMRGRMQERKEKNKTEE